MRTRPRSPEVWPALKGGLPRKPPLFTENLSLERLLTPPGLSWGPFGRTWAPPGCSWAVFWGSCGILGRLGQALAKSCGVLACLGKLLGGLVESWGGLGAVFGRSWGVLAAKIDQERGGREF